MTEKGHERKEKGFGRRVGEKGGHPAPATVLPSCDILLTHGSTGSSCPNQLLFGRFAILCHLSRYVVGLGKEKSRVKMREGGKEAHKIETRDGGYLYL